MEFSQRKKFWDRNAKKYELFMKKDKKAYEKVYSLIKNSLNKDMQVLEIATGTGIVARNISNSANCIEAIDYSEEMIKVARRKSNEENVFFSVQDAYDLNYEDNSFDAVIIMNTLHIVEEPEKILNEIHRVLKKDGILFAPTFMPKDKAFKVNMLSKLTGFKSYKAWSREDFIEFINSNGFDVKYTELLKGSFPITYLESTIS
jgi:ubiquinone/menaquinone biosynthesis C-methylase UbiE